MALLTPQWQREAQDFQKASEERQKQRRLELEQDAHRALEFQRERLSLQKQLDRKAIDKDTYTAKERPALASISDLRKKYEAFGGILPQTFDGRLESLTKALADNPATPIPHSQVGQGPPDFHRDVKIAAQILIKEQENRLKVDKKPIASDTFRETAIVYQRDLSRLEERYSSRGEEFLKAYTRLAEATLHPHAPPTPPKEREPYWYAFLPWALMLFVGLVVIAFFNHFAHVPPLKLFQNLVRGHFL